MVSLEILKVVQPMALDAALDAAEQLARPAEWAHACPAIGTGTGPLEARLAARRYEAIDPENRLAAAELESRWNTALSRMRELESKVTQVEQESVGATLINRETTAAWLR